MKLRFQVRRNYDRRLEIVNSRILKKINRHHMIDEMTYVKWQKDINAKKISSKLVNTTSFGMWVSETDYKLCWTQCAIKFYIANFLYIILKGLHAIRIKNLKSALVICALLIGALIIFMPQMAYGYSVYLNGEDVGVVKDPQVFESALDNIEDNMSEWYNIGDLYYEHTVVYTKAPVTKVGSTMDSEECKRTVYDNGFDLYVKGVVIYVDGQELASVGSKEDGENLIKELTMQYSSTTDNEKLLQDAQIDQKITMEEKIIPLSQVETVEDVVASVFGTKDTSTENIAAANDSVQVKSVSELSDQNKIMTAFSIDKDKFKTTQTSNSKPLLTIRTVKEVNFTEDVQYGSKYQYDSTMFEGAERVASEGVLGQDKITAIITYENGTEISRQVLAKERIKDPVDEVLILGTMALPSVASSGNFIIPASGVVSAVNKPGSHAGGRAVDIANKVGTPIYATDAGVVAMATWNSGYGMCIIIKHANGYSSLYGHLSGYKVSVGQTVSQGQVIASMGNTGNSTGSHLHFAIRYNDSPQVILTYFPYLSVGRRVTALQP
ncbi:MAG: peptidoglycan DD-metalloendopeptidase family protein [Eubacteriaceae bacterium]